MDESVGLENIMYKDIGETLEQFNARKILTNHILNMGYGYTPITAEVIGRMVMNIAIYNVKYHDGIQEFLQKLIIDKL